jgi:hypothetical protein
LQIIISINLQDGGVDLFLFSNHRSPTSKRDLSMELRSFASASKPSHIVPPVSELPTADMGKKPDFASWTLPLVPNQPSLILPHVKATCEVKVVVENATQTELPAHAMAEASQQTDVDAEIKAAVPLEDAACDQGAKIQVGFL